MSSSAGGLDQIVGALLTAFGGGLTVLGLNLMKKQQLLHGHFPWRFSDAGARWRWAGGFLCWCVGQITMTGGTYFATVTVCSASSNVAVGINAYIAHRMFGERFNLVPPAATRGPTRQWPEWDLGGLLVMLAGASLIVVSAPTLPHASDTRYTSAMERSMLARPVAFAITLLLGLGLILVCLPWSFMQFNPTAQARPSSHNVGGDAVAASDAPDNGPNSQDGGEPLVIVDTVGSGGGCSVSTTTQALCFGLIAGACGGYTFLPVKLALACDNCMSQGWFYLMWLWAGAAEVLLVLSLNTGMVRLPLSGVVIVSTYYISATVITQLMGLATFDLFLHFSGSSAAQFLVGLIMCLGGVVVISNRKGQEAVTDPSRGSNLSEASACSNSQSDTLHEPLLGRGDCDG